MRSLLCFQALLLSVVSAAPPSDTERQATQAITGTIDHADYRYHRITLDPVNATTGGWWGDVTSQACYIPDAAERNLQWARRRRSRQSSEHAFFIVLPGAAALRSISGTTLGHGTTSHTGHHGND
ncbi:hypothetical protein MTO96_034140 [Rhipicephalus appendiculatus]